LATFFRLFKNIFKKTQKNLHYRLDNGFYAHFILKIAFLRQIFVLKTNNKNGQDVI